MAFLGPISKQRLIDRRIKPRWGIEGFRWPGSTYEEGCYYARAGRHMVSISNQPENGRLWATHLVPIPIREFGDNHPIWDVLLSRSTNDVANKVDKVMADYKRNQERTHQKTQELITARAEDLRALIDRVEGRVSSVGFSQQG